MIKFLHLNNIAMPDVVEIQDALFKELHNRVVVFEEDRAVFKAALRQLQREVRDENPSHTKVMEDLDSAKDGEIDISFSFYNPPPPLPPINSYVVESFDTGPSNRPPFI